MRSLLATCVMAMVLLVSLGVRAETWQAPLGGKALSLGQARVACAGTSGDWVIEQNGHALRPPSGDEAIGRTTELKVAPDAAACATSTTSLTLRTTAKWPTIDPSTIALHVDDARLEFKGHGLRGIVVRWRSADRSGEDACIAPQLEAGVERCAVAVARGISADPTTISITWLPYGSRVAPDVVTFDANARRIALDDAVTRPARIVITSIIPGGASIDLAGGTASRIALVHPEAVGSADCGAATCEVASGALVVHTVTNAAASLGVRLRLLPRVFLRRGDVLDPSPLVDVPVLPCSMSIPSGDAPQGIEATKIVVRIDPRCAGEAASFRYFARGRALDILGVVEERSSAYVLLGVGRVEGDELVVTASRGAADGSSVGQARVKVRPLPLPRATISLANDSTPLDFIPTNRPAVVRFVESYGAGKLVLAAVDGVYDIATKDGATTIIGESNAAGLVSLRFAYRVPTLPGTLAATDLATIVEPVQRPMRDANVAAPLGASAMSGKPIVELVCTTAGVPQSIAPGATAHVAFVDRNSCRVVLHRERLSPEDGAQMIALDIEVTRVDGAARPEARTSQSIVLRAGAESRYAWIRGVLDPFDHVTIRVSHVVDESHYVAATELRTGAPAIQWSVIFGTEHFRLYATTAIPTGLYRVSDPGHSGILSLNLGVIMRGTWLDSEGHAGFLGLEAGVMGLGLANDVDSSGHSLTQVATVTGIGLSVPIANRSLATETSINLHAWFEYEISRDLGHAPGSPFGLVFGPSISIGNVGTNL